MSRVRVSFTLFRTVCLGAVLCFSISMAALFLPGCSGGKSESKDPDMVKPAPQNVPAAPAPEPAPKAIDIGDVEACILVAGSIPAEGKPANVEVDELRTARDRLVMSTITVKPPYPAQLLVTFSIELPTRDFADQPVVLRGTVMRDEQPLQPQFATIVSVREPASDAKHRQSFTVDVLQGLAAPPKTMLVSARMDAFLTPLLVKEADIDPDTAQSNDRTQLLSNPVRINFVEAAQ